MIYQIWMDGYATTGESAPVSYHGEFAGGSFRDACLVWAARKNMMDHFDAQRLTYWGCRLHPLDPRKRVLSNQDFEDGANLFRQAKEAAYYRDKKVEAAVYEYKVEVRNLLERYTGDDDAIKHAVELLLHRKTTYDHKL